MEYPECEKLESVENHVRGILEFQEYLQSKGYIVCEYGEDEDGEDQIMPVSKTFQNMIYEVYDIDPDKLEEERRQLLEEMRN